MNSHLIRGVSPPAPQKKVYVVLYTNIPFVSMLNVMFVSMSLISLSEVDLFAHTLSEASFILEIKERRRDIKYKCVHIFFCYFNVVKIRL